MELQRIVDESLRYPFQKISEDEELTLEVQRKLIDLNLLDPPADGVFGSISSAALERFQGTLSGSEPGILGAKTASSLLESVESTLPKLVLKVRRDTIFKNRPIQSSSLGDSEKVEIPMGSRFDLISCEGARNNHFRIVTRGQELKERIWYAFAQHIEIYTGDRCTYPKQQSSSVKIPVPYKSQLDNSYNPTGSCNVTALAMCLAYLQIPRKSDRGQYEDELYEYAIDRGLSRHDPYDLARIVRDYGAKDDFKEGGTIDGCKEWLAGENPAIIHGYFTSFGHIVVLIGYDQDGFIVHDPYGEYFASGYRTDLSGQELHYSYDLIRQTCIPDGNLWTHFISV